MSSTHYMDLLMQNSPWNLILFMAIPVVLAEAIAITELLIPLLSERAELTKKVNRVSGVLAGIAFIGIILYLVPAVVLPLASNGEFRTWCSPAARFQRGIQDLGRCSRHLLVPAGGHPDDSACATQLKAVL